MIRIHHTCLCTRLYSIRIVSALFGFSAEIVYCSCFVGVMARAKEIRGTATRGIAGNDGFYFFFIDIIQTRRFRGFFRTKSMKYDSFSLFVYGKFFSFIRPPEYKSSCFFFCSLCKYLRNNNN